MSLSVEAVALAKTYTDNSIKGITGTLAGKNCTIKSTTKVDTTTTIVFEWTADDGTVNTSSVQIEDGYTPIKGVDYNDGTDGTNGIGISDVVINVNNHVIVTLSNGRTVDAGEVAVVNPTIVVKESTTDKYVLTITDKNGSYDTPNLKASSSGGTLDYTDLTNKPSVNSVTLSGNKSLADLGLLSEVDTRKAITQATGDLTKLTITSVTDLVSAINYVYGLGMASIVYSNKNMVLTTRSGNVINIDVSSVITDTNIEEFKNVVIDSVVDNQVLTYDATSEKWVNKTDNSASTLASAKDYTDNAIADLEKTSAVVVDAKPSASEAEKGVWYYYKVDETWYQTIYIGDAKTEVTISAGTIDLSDYVSKTKDVVSVFEENPTDLSKIPDLQYMSALRLVLIAAIGKKINKTDIVDSLTSEATDAPLSANQGRTLKAQIDAIINDETASTTTTYSSSKVADLVSNVKASWVGTRAEYEAMDKSLLKDGEVVNITDDNTNGIVINDSAVSTATTYSSNKIEEELDDKLDDTQLVSTWSATTSDENIASEKLVKDSIDAVTDSVSKIGTIYDFSTSCSVTANGWSVFSVPLGFTLPKGTYVCILGISPSTNTSSQGILLMTFDGSGTTIGGYKTNDFWKFNGACVKSYSGDATTVTINIYNALAAASLDCVVSCTFVKIA